MTEQWIYRRRVDAARIRLFCFAYAGGTAAAYTGWMERLGARVEVCAVELPGRRTRSREPSIRRMDSLADATAEGLRPFMDLPFAFFGHSMGAVLAFEVARRTRAAAAALPRAVFLSAASAPHLPVRRRPLWRLPDAEFLAAVQAYGGIPEELLADPDMAYLWDYFLPVLRADFELFGTYRFEPEPQLECPIHVYGGIADEQVPAVQITAWRELAAGPFSAEFFHGGHFYLQDRFNELAASITNHLDRHCFAEVG